MGQTNQKSVGTVELPYHEIKRQKYNNLTVDVNKEQDIAYIIGLFSCLEDNVNDPDYEKKLDTTSEPLRSQSDLSKCMEKKWETRAKVKINNTETRKIFPGLKKESELTLNFKNPNDFLQDEMVKVIERDEARLQNEEKGLTHINNIINIIDNLINYIDDNYTNTSKLITKETSDMNKFIDNFLLSDLGKDFMSMLNDNIYLNEIKDLLEQKKEDK